MAKLRGLHLRGSVYYSRTLVPKELVAKFGRKQIWKSLGTSNKDEAEALHLQEAAYWKAAFVEAAKVTSRGPPSPPSVADTVLTDADAARLSHRFFDRARAKLDSKPSSADLDDWERERLVEDLQTQLSSLSALGVAVIFRARKTAHPSSRSKAAEYGVAPDRLARGVQMLGGNFDGAIVDLGF